MSVMAVAVKHLIAAGVTGDALVTVIAEMEDADGRDARFYVYEHYGKTTGELFYIGKGTGGRCDSSRDRNVHWHKRVEEEGGFYAVIVKDGLYNEDALARESHLIKLASSRLELTNIAGVRDERR